MEDMGNEKLLTNTKNLKFCCLNCNHGPHTNDQASIILQKLSINESSGKVFLTDSRGGFLEFVNNK